MSPLAFLDDLDLRGERVRLRRPRVEDSEALHAHIAGRREILDWIEWPGPRNVEELREKARHWRTESDDAANYHLAIERLDTNEVAGALSLRFVDHPRTGDVGYWIAVPHQNRGLASEAVALTAWLAFDALGADGLTACVFEGNLASRRVLEKLGFDLRRTEGCGGLFSPRPRWSFELARAAWLARGGQRPVEFELAFAGRRP